MFFTIRVIKLLRYIFVITWNFTLPGYHVIDLISFINTVNVLLFHSQYFYKNFITFAFYILYGVHKCLETQVGVRYYHYRLTFKAKQKI